MKFNIIYWSASGNTEAMASALLNGATSKGLNAKLLSVSEASLQDVEEADIVALGCPSMGAEVLEESEMEPFVESLSVINWSSKKLILFGSYDWGDGAWMRDWESRMSDLGANLVQEGYITKLAPSVDVIDDLKKLASSLA